MKEAAERGHEVPTRTLLVVAHPDDEYYCAAAIFRLARERGHSVDQVIVTDGAGGYKFAHLAGTIYGLEIGEENLPAIRRREAERAARLLGIDRQWFFAEPDPGFTLEAEEALACWNVPRIEARLAAILDEGAYDQAIVLLPRASEHGHHQAIATIAGRVIEAMHPADRPSFWGVEPGLRGEAPEPFAAMRQRAFSREEATAADARVPYHVVVNWVIAEHKSQGLFQLETGRHDTERFYLLAEAEREDGRFELALF